MAAVVQRARVLALYRKVMRTAKQWTAAEPSQSPEERRYAVEETRRLFRANKDLTNPAQIDACLVEASSRLDISVHYQNPYPRPVQHMSSPSGRTSGRKSGRGRALSGVFPLSKKQLQGQQKTGKAQQRIRDQSLPAYLRSSNN